MASLRTRREPAQIGPNAILQTAHVIDRQLGEELRRELLAEAGIVRLPTGETMVDESDALALHYAIALELGISQHTVHTYLSRLYRKLGVTSRVQLVLSVLDEFPLREAARKVMHDQLARKAVGKSGAGLSLHPSERF